MQQKKLSKIELFWYVLTALSFVALIAFFYYNDFVIEHGTDPISYMQTKKIVRKLKEEAIEKTKSHLKQKYNMDNVQVNADGEYEKYYLYFGEDISPEAREVYVSVIYKEKQFGCVVTEDKVLDDFESDALTQDLYNYILSKLKITNLKKEIINYELVQSYMNEETQYEWMLEKKYDKKNIEKYYKQFSPDLTVVFSNKATLPSTLLNLTEKLMKQSNVEASREQCFKFISLKKGTDFSEEMFYDVEAYYPNVQSVDEFRKYRNHKHIEPKLVPIGDYGAQGMPGVYINKVASSSLKVGKFTKDSWWKSYVPLSQANEILESNFFTQETVYLYIPKKTVEDLKAKGYKRVWFAYHHNDESGQDFEDNRENTTFSLSGVELKDGEPDEYEEDYKLINGYFIIPFNFEKQDSVILLGE